MKISDDAEAYVKVEIIRRSIEHLTESLNYGLDDGHEKSLYDRLKEEEENLDKFRVSNPELFV